MAAHGIASETSEQSLRTHSECLARDLTGHGLALPEGFITVNRINPVIGRFLTHDSKLLWYAVLQANSRAAGLLTLVKSRRGCD